MARPVTPDGKRVTICTKVSEPAAAAIDRARGDVSRSGWVASLIAAALGGADLPPRPKSPPAPACKHSRALKGWCNECKTGGH